MTDQTLPPAMPVINPDTGQVAKPRTWVLVRDGIVERVHRTADWFHHPFGKSAEGARVVDGTGIDVQPGDMVDAKGNFTPAEGRLAPIPEGLPAYHAGPGVVRHTVDVSAELGGAVPITSEGEDKTDPSSTLDPALATVEPRNKDMAEHDDGLQPVHTTDTGDAAADAAPDDKAPKKAAKKD